MDEQIKQIAERLRGLRDVLELTLKTLPVNVTSLLMTTVLPKREILISP